MRDIVELVGEGVADGSPIAASGSSVNGSA
jgi:hypothetical protein